MIMALMTLILMFLSEYVDCQLLWYDVIVICVVCCLIIAIGPFWLSSLSHSSIEEVVFSIVKVTMVVGRGGLLTGCSGSFGPCSMT
jgi:hypothetical protein